MKQMRADQIELVNRKILEGVIVRTQHIIWFFAFAFTIFGFYTYPIFSKHIPDLTVWQNTYPRILANTIPFLLLKVFLNSSRFTHAQRITVWCLALPLILLAASWIYCWPLILSGNSDVFFLVHTQNTFVLSIWFLYAAPPLRYAFYMLATCTMFFLMPLSLVILKGVGESYIINIFLNDVGAAMAINFIVARATVRLRWRLAIEDVHSKEQTKRLLGGRLAEAIFEKREDLLNGFERPAVIVAIDLRGFTKLFIDVEKTKVDLFMSKYHEIVTTNSGRYGGFLHKSSGDGHLLSFGLMDDYQDLSDIPELSDRVASADEARRRHLFSRADWMMAEIVDQLGKLKDAHPEFAKTRIGAGISFGNIAVRLIGDNKYRQEFDFTGLPIIEAVRLESFTKNLNKVDSEADAIVASTLTFEEEHLKTHGFSVMKLEADRVRDFEKVDSIIYKTYINHRVSKKESA